MYQIIQHPGDVGQGPAWKEMMQDRRMSSDLMREEEKTCNLETPGQCRREVLSKEGETTKINFSWFVVQPEINQGKADLMQFAASKLEQVYEVPSPSTIGLCTYKVGGRETYLTRLRCPTDRLNKITRVITAFVHSEHEWKNYPP